MPRFEVLFPSEDTLLELELLTRVMGSGGRNPYPIRALGIKSEGLRVINILADYACEVERNGYKLIIPERAVYVIQKILTNPERVPKNKRQKDIMAVDELLVHIKQSEYNMNMMREIYSKLTKKQLATIKKVTDENFIDLFN